MKFLKKTLKALLCASLVLSLGISATACSTEQDPDGTDEPPTGDEPVYTEKPFTPPDDGSEGIDWTKYWDGVTATGTTTDNFTFTGSKDIGTLTGDYTPPVTPATEGESVIVSFSDGVSAQSVDYGGLAVKPSTPQKSGNQFIGWYTDSELNTEYDFNLPVTANIPLYAKWVALPSNIESVVGNHESIAVTFKGGADTTVQYKMHGSGQWQPVDSELVRAYGSSARVDILGLAAGKYDVKIGDTELNSPVTVDAYDRSGYAHFKYTEGVGAYKDDGTLKDNALVIYVTEKNKDTVMNEVCAANSDVTMFQIPGTTWQSKNASGIGWWLNNAQYTKTDKKGNKGNTWASNGNSLGFKNSGFNRPVVVRFIGEVTTPEGCTKYDSLDEGGSVGDNGHMARMRNLKNITIEGVGDDAVIKGWGFHFMAGSDQKNGEGRNFEVRNLTFTEYPEDAVGMEGVQDGNKITGPVERCWIHHNTFLPGYCASPAESDKKEGDGSCDFKRGQYYTCSYNYFEYCHKTNLIGSSDSSLQFNISMHHNMWYQCGSRIPLLRQANVHFYNNYVYGDSAEKDTPYSHIAKPALSYVHSLRANSYLFSEANYYEGCKNVTDGKTDGTAKSWNDVTTQCFGTNLMVKADTREQQVGNKCAYDTINYSSFDTNPSQFYYDSESKKTDALLDGPVSARTRVLYEVGASGFEPRLSHEKTKSTPQTNLSNLTLPKGGKAKGEVIVFKLAAQTEVKLTVTATDLYDNYGRVWYSDFSGSKTLILPAGTYVLASSIKDKEGIISDVKFTEGEGASDARVEAAKQALAAIPSIITISSETLINEAKEAYSALLNEAERNQIDAELVERYSKASAAYEELLVDFVVKRIEYIGTVTADSYVKINAARNAYNKLSADKQAKVTNYDTLEAAWNTFANFEVDNVVNRLNDLPDLTASDVNIKSTATLEKLYDWFEAVQDAYNDLKDDDGVDKRDQVSADSLKKLTDGLQELNSVEKFLEFKETLEGVSVAEATSVGGTIVSLYNDLSDAYKAKLTAEESAKYEAISEAYSTALANTVVTDFNNDSGTPTNDDPAYNFAKTGGTKKSASYTIDGVTYAKGFKMPKNGGATLTFTVPSSMTKMTLTLYFYDSAGLTVVIDGEEYTIGSDGIVTATLEAGNHSVTSGAKEINLYLLKLTQA